MTSKPSGPTRHPFVAAVQGLKNSGKTTVARALIAGFAARGWRVAAVKTSHLDRLALDPEGKDSRILYDAGAECIIAQGRLETLSVRRHDRPAPFAQLLGGLPPGIDIVVAEGGAAVEGDAVLLCLRSLEDLEETLRVRKVQPGRVCALSGLAAAGHPVSESAAAGLSAARSSAAGLSALPLFDAATPAGCKALVALLVAAASRRAAPISGPRTS